MFLKVAPFAEGLGVVSGGFATGEARDDVIKFEGFGGPALGAFSCEPFPFLPYGELVSGQAIPSHVKGQARSGANIGVSLLDLPRGSFE